MKYFIDTEFTERFSNLRTGRKLHTTELISIGIVCEDGREYYAISNEFYPEDANDWVKENVISKLDKTIPWKSNAQIAKEVEEFCGKYPVFFGYYADYDWVVVSSLFGTMVNLPESWPMYCRDLKQTFDEKAESIMFSQQGEYAIMGLSHAVKFLREHKDYPKQENEHNALDDARWNHNLYKFIMGY